MLTTALVTGDLVARALNRIAEAGITVQPWTSRDHTGDGKDVDHPILYLVEPDAEPPRSWGPLEDWVRTTVDSQDLYYRADRLLDRAFHLGAMPVSLDEDDILRIGRSLTILSVLEARLLRALLAEPGEVVSRQAATDALWPHSLPADPRALDNRLKNLRQRLKGLPFRVHTVRGRGLLLEWNASVAEFDALHRPAGDRRSSGPDRDDSERRHRADVPASRPTPTSRRSDEPSVHTTTDRRRQLPATTGA